MVTTLLSRFDYVPGESAWRRHPELNEDIENLHRVVL